MSIQSFNFSVDNFNNLEKPIIYIARKDKTILDSVSIYDDLSITLNLNAFHTATFKIYKELDGVENSYFYDFEEDMLIMIPGVSWFKIHVETVSEHTGTYKLINATSLECMLCYKRLVDFQVNSDDFEDTEYTPTIFYNPNDHKKSLLHRVLNTSALWTVGHVDASLEKKQRTFDESDIDVYSFLTGSVSEAFNCLFIFDTFNYTVNAYDLDNYGQNTDIFVSMDNLAENMKQTIDENSIITCYKIMTSEFTNVAEINPNGTNKIYNFDYYIPYLPESLQKKVMEYNKHYTEIQPSYEYLVEKLAKEIEVIQELNTRLPSDMNSKNWKLYGFEFLSSKKKTLENQYQVACAQGMNNPNSLNYSQYTSISSDLSAVTSEYQVRKAEIANATSNKNVTLNVIREFQEQLNMNLWFTEDEWKTLDSYVIEQTFSNDNFASVSNTTESELFDLEKQLMESAVKDLAKKSRPQYQYSSTLLNILTIPEFKDFLKCFALGNFIQMQTDYDVLVKLRIISYTVDFSNTQNIDVVFSDAVRIHDVYDDAASIQSQANAIAMSFKFNKDQYDKSVYQSNFVEDLRKYGLDVSITGIHNSQNQNQVWDETGMTFRQWNNQRQDYDPEQIKIINNMIVFSDDNFQSAKMAIGKIPVGDNKYAYGINAEYLVAKMILSENMWIENNSGTYKFDDNGFVASNGTNSIKIQPNKNNELFSIYKGDKKTFFIDDNGNLNFSGSLNGAIGMFRGEMNVANKFFVTNKGEMISKSGIIGGWVINEDSIRGGYTTLSSSGQIECSGAAQKIIIDNEWISATNNVTNQFLTINSGIINITQQNQYNSSSTMISSKEIITGDFSCNGLVVQKDTLIGIKPQIILSGQTTLSGNVILAGNTTFNSALFFTDSARTIGNVSFGSSNSVPTYIYHVGFDNGNECIPSASWVKEYAKKYFVTISSYSSDARLKTNITDLPDISNVYMNIKPKKFKFNNILSGYDKDWHFGIIAQDIEKAMLDNGYSTENINLVYKVECDEDFKEKELINDDYVYKVDKNELHAMHMQMIQRHHVELEQLKEEIQKIKEKIYGECI